MLYNWTFLSFMHARARPTTTTITYNSDGHICSANHTIKSKELQVEFKKLFQECNFCRWWGPVGTCGGIFGFAPTDDLQLGWQILPILFYVLRWIRSRTNFHQMVAFFSMPSLVKEEGQSCTPFLAHFLAIRNLCSVFELCIPCAWRRESWSSL